MPAPAVRPEVILPLQETVSTHIEEVHNNMGLGRISLASTSMNELLKVGQRINYAAVGRADIDIADSADQLESERDNFFAERDRLERWLGGQHGANLTKNPKLLNRILSAQDRIKAIEAKLIPKAETKISAFEPAVEEIESIAELTGEAWPYYPELSPGRRGQKDVVSEKVETQPATDNSYRSEIHNIISRLSYDKKGGMGLRYNVLTAFFFNQKDAEAKAKLAQALASMIRDGEVKIWQEGDERFIESTLPETTKPKDETEAKMIVVQLDLEDEITRSFVTGVFRNYGLEGYRRIERDDKLELQVPLAFANRFALSYNLVLSKHGPSSYRLLNNE